jgi:hypothetical protein
VEEQEIGALNSVVREPGGSQSVSDRWKVLEAFSERKLAFLVGIIAEEDVVASVCRVWAWQVQDQKALLSALGWEGSVWKLRHLALLLIAGLWYLLISLGSEEG